MDREQRLANIRSDIRDRMITAVFEPLVLTHLEALEISQEKGQLFSHSDHTWEIDRVMSIWTISCQGLYDWSFQFDADWRTDSAGCRYLAIDTVIVKYNPILDTAGHLKMAVEFVSNYLLNTNPDGSVNTH